MSDSDKAKSKAVTRKNYESMLEQRIQQAFEDGLFDNLPGAGKPLKLDDDSLVAEENRAAYRLLSSNGFTLPWIAARQDIDEEHHKLGEWLKQANRRWSLLDSQGQAILRVNYRKKIADLNQMILTFNLNAPKGVEQLATLHVPTELLKLGKPSES
jgi:DnaJ family protein C protein 28